MCLVAWVLQVLVWVPQAQAQAAQVLSALKASWRALPQRKPAWAALLERGWLVWKRRLPEALRARQGI